MKNFILLTILSLSTIGNGHLFGQVIIKNSGNHSVTVSTIDGFKIQLNQNDSTELILKADTCPVKKIQLFVENRQTLKFGAINFLITKDHPVILTLTNTDSLLSGSGYYFSELPFKEVQQLYKTKFLPQKSVFENWAKSKYEEKKKFTPDDNKRDSIENLMSEERKKYLEYVVDFIREIKQSYLALEVFREEILSQKNVFNMGKERIIAAYNLLDTNYAIPASRSYTDSIIALMKANLIGAVISDFSFKTNKAEVFSLKQLTKKSPILLIFTSKFCAACVAQIPAVRQIESEMGANLKIVYISLDRTVAEWESSLKERQYPGIHTLNLAPYNFNVDLQQKFFNQYIPQVFLIGKNQQILFDSFSPYENDNELSSLKEILGIKN